MNEQLATKEREIRKFSRGCPISIYPSINNYNFDDINTIWKNDPKEADSTDAEPLNIYLHIPFCPKRCGYCYYNNLQVGKAIIEKYVRHLLKEIDLVAEIPYVKHRKFHSIYIGGGTPTYLPVNMLRSVLQKIRDSFVLTDDYELSIEVRPGNEVNQEKVDCLKSMGVNRISIGAQSFDQEILEKNGRPHKVEKFYEIYNMFQEAGFKNINIDLMSGMLYETMESWDQTIDKVLNLNPTGITCYKMHVYRKSTVFDEVEASENPEEMLNDVREVEMIRRFSEKVFEAGYQIFDIESSFIKSRKYSNAHQRNVQTGREFIGIGLSANAFVNGHVYQNSHDIEEYFERVEQGNLPAKRAYRIPDNIVIKRALVYGIRRTFMEIDDFQSMYGENLIDFISKNYGALFDEGILYVDGNLVRLREDLRIYTDDITKKYVMSEQELYMEELLSNHKNIVLFNKQDKQKST